MQCLNQHWFSISLGFSSLEETRRLPAAWREDDNAARQVRRKLASFSTDSFSRKKDPLNSRLNGGRSLAVVMFKLVAGGKSTE